MVMGKKKILYVITKSNWGGAQKYVYDLATNLPQDKFDAAVVVGGRGPLTDQLREAGVRTIILPTLQETNSLGGVLFAPVNFRALFTLFNIYRKERPDVIHLNSSKIGGLGAVAAKVASLAIGHWSLVIFSWFYKTRIFGCFGNNWDNYSSFIAQLPNF